MANVAPRWRGAPAFATLWRMPRASHVLLVAVCAFVVGAAPAQRPRRMTVFLRGKPQTVRIYDPPPGAPRRRVQVLVTSGDLGWWGISGDVPGHLQQQGYRVIGLNAQSYEVAFTGPHGEQLQPRQIAGDYDTIMQAASVDTVFPPAFVSIGVSEGAGLAVVALGQAGASDLCVGVIGLGLPMKTALAWRWTDFPSWITKAEPHEPEVATADFLPRLKVPLVVIHSIHDEYDRIENVRAIVGTAAGPRRFIPVDAPNHRFSHRIQQVLALVDSSIIWMDSLRQARRGLP